MLESKKRMFSLLLIMIKFFLCRGQLISSKTSISSPSYSFVAPLSSLSRYTGQTFASNLSEFASRIYQKTVAENSGNLVMSPLSADTVLALLSLGAKASTCTELENGLLLPTNAKSATANQFETILKPMQNNSQILMANGIFIEKGYKIRQKFSSMAQTQFYSNVTNINFDNTVKAVNTLNNWVSEKTHGKISNMFNSQTIQNIKMLLINAIYFNGKWSTPFSRENSYKEMFQFGNCNNTNEKMLKMMHNAHKYNYGNISSLKAEVVELPYKNSFSNMLIFLPWACNGLSELENLLTTFDLSTLDKHMNGGAYQVVLTLPKFSIHSTINLKPILKSMGMEKMFNPNEANFEDLLSSRSSSLSSSSSEVGLYVSKVLQKAMIDVDELGSVAAAVTYAAEPGYGGRPGVSSQRPKIIYFQATRPFMYMIRNKEYPLFMGRFVN